MLRPISGSLLFTFMALIGAATAARAASVCLDGPGATGFSHGPSTLAFSNASGFASTITSGPVCEPGNVLSTPTLFDFSGAGEGLTGANQNGLYNSATTMTVATPSAIGTGRATSGSNMEILFRINSLSGYSGSGTEMLDFAIAVSGFGSGMATGPGSSFGGTYNFSASVGQLNGPMALLYTGSGGAALGGFGGTTSGTTPIQVDTDYVFSIGQTLQLLSSGGYDGFNYGTASAESWILSNFELGLPSQSADLELSFLMSDTLGVPAPVLNGPVPTTVPLPAAVWLLVSGLAGLGWLARRNRSRKIGYHFVTG
ncbi:VPLPA-CTERM sorting domain-containing protein [Methylomonas methanica]|uniref:Variant PEP-CTERM exosortase signal n=1 Tax=Methylomonas methanica (strain DSM 25384 / MC09) TaxID=857087 RepID=F9ZVR7_METMM|nr:VPLPA-CTERM sorting domain-containing protein [Methylomonas methanica]AEF99545.1 variant PEP-CTERM exosortase signal [Methylomonas methanica MC09]